MGRFDGKVVVITGAGRGLGKAYAIAFAREGAKVVVNDLGVERDGTGTPTNVADKVVEEIKALGGDAIANYDNIATMQGARNLMDTAMKHYGKIDILINNAGILRDRTLLKMSEDEWDAVIAVHLKGTFACSQAAARIMKEQRWGRIINTTSYAGLIGNFGQTNYGAAKAGIYGFTRCLSLELERYNITVNAIAPLAKTRLTEDIEAVPKEFKPEHVVPMVLYLASEEASAVTGRVFGIHGNHLFEYKMVMTPGVEKKDGDYWTVEEIHQKFEEITKLPKASEEMSVETIKSILPRLNEIIKPLGLQVVVAGEEVVTTEKKSEGLTISDMFQALKEVFLPDKAGSFSGLIQFEIEGDQPQAIYIHDGTVEIKAERGQNPKGTITTDAETIKKLFKGELDPAKAIMSGKIKVDKMPIIMKFGQMFDLQQLPKKFAKEKAVTSEKPKRKGLNREYIGKWFTGRAQHIKPSAIRAYAKATNDNNPRYLTEDESQMAVPPLFPVTLLRPVLQKVLMDEGLNMDLLHMVHAEHEVRYYRPLKPWDLVYPVAEIVDIEEKSTGELMTTKIEGRVSGELVFEMIAKFFVRNPEAKKAKKEDREEGKMEEIPRGKELFTHKITVESDQAKRYAEVSGDDNPIHLDPETARAAGLPDVILHGLCTMAFAAQAVVNNILKGDPRRLEHIKVRFARPVFMGDILTTTGWLVEETDDRIHIIFETRNQRGELVLSHGKATVLKN